MEDSLEGYAFASIGEPWCIVGCQSCQWDKERGIQQNREEKMQAGAYHHLGYISVQVEGGQA